MATSNPRPEIRSGSPSTPPDITGFGYWTWQGTLLIPPTPPINKMAALFVFVAPPFLHDESGWRPRPQEGAYGSKATLCWWLRRHRGGLVVGAGQKGVVAGRVVLVVLMWSLDVVRWVLAACPSRAMEKDGKPAPRTTRTVGPCQPSAAAAAIAIETERSAPFSISIILWRSRRKFRRILLNQR